MKLSTQTHFSQGWSRSLLKDIEGLGGSTIRDGISWGKVEASRGKYDFSHYSANWIPTADAAGFEKLVVFQPNNALYDNGHTVHTDAGRAAFARFVVKTLEAFPSIGAIEIGNEYNGNHFVTGTIAKAPKAKRDDYYAAMLDAVAKAIDTAGLKVTVVGASTHSIPVDYLADLKAHGALQDLDAISIHPYTTPPEQLPGQIAVLRKVIGNEVDIHVTEFGSNFAHLAEAPAYLAKMVSAMAASGIANANWYAFDQQDFFPNMELWDGRKSAPTPAGETFAVLQELLEGNVAVKRVATDAATHFYMFGNDGAVIWGEPRSIKLGAGIAAFDVRGNRLDSVTSISTDAPIILKSAGRIDTGAVQFGPSDLLADSYHHFDLTNERGGTGGFEGPWSYFAENGHGKQYVLYTMNGGMTGGEPWTPYLGADWLRPLQVNGATVTPADFSKTNDPSSEYAIVERFTSPFATKVSLTAHWDVLDTTTNGVLVSVRVNGDSIFSSKVFSPKNGHVLDVALNDIALGKGDTIEFVLDPLGDAKGDITERRFQIFASDEKGEKPQPSAPEAEKPASPAPAKGLTLKGTAKQDTFHGTSGNDKLDGKGGADSLYGGAGDDVLHGGAGNDLIEGGDGNDRLTGGHGRDIFMFEGDFGDDVITDFSNADRLDLSAFGYKNFAELDITYFRDHALVEVGETSIKLLNIAKGALQADDFIL